MLINGILPFLKIYTDNQLMNLISLLLALVFWNINCYFEFNPQFLEIQKFYKKLKEVNIFE